MIVQSVVEHSGNVVFTFTPSASAMKMLAVTEKIRGLPRRRIHTDKGTTRVTVPPSPEVLRFFQEELGAIPPHVLHLFKPFMQIDAQRPHVKAVDLALTYKPKTNPFTHQHEALVMLAKNHVFALFDEMGTGKSKTIVDAAAHLCEEGVIDAVLLVCPNTVKGTWTDPEWGQIAKHLPDRFCVTVSRVDGRHIKPSVRNPTAPHKLEWIVINYESLRTNHMQNYFQTWTKSRRVMMVLDESSRIKSPSAQQTKACLTLGKFAQRRYILSGTPITRNPLDLFSQFLFLNPAILGYSSFVAFRARYAVMGGLHIHGRPVQVVNWQHLNELEDRTASYSRRVLKKDCLDLPEKIYERRTVSLTPDQWTHYQNIKRELMTTISTGDVNGKLSVNNALTRVLRFTQITSGCLPHEVYDEEGKLVTERVFHFDPNPKMQAVEEILDECDAKVVVFCMFHTEIHDLIALCNKQGVGYAQLHGNVPDKQRDAEKGRFQTDPKCRVMIAQVATGGIGIDLTAASVVVYTTNSYSWEHRAQSEDRAHRQGQRSNVTYIDLLATGPDGQKTIDHKVIQAVLLKKNIADLVLGDLLEDI